MKAKDLARYVIDKGNSVNNYTLNKILYLAHCYYMMKTGKELIEEKFEAWAIGPIIPEVYREFSIYSGAPIIPFYKLEYKMDPEIDKVIWKLVRNLSSMELWKLPNLYNFDGSAWSKTYVKGKYLEIHPSLIRHDVEENYM